MEADSEESLDSRLVQVALELIEQDGLEGLSLRRIAREAGVSHSAPLRHYRSLADLLSEVAARGFQLLSETVEKAGASLPGDALALERLNCAGRDYVQVATQHPGLFALMFRPEDLDVENANFRLHSQKAFARLVDLVRLAQDQGWKSEHDTPALAALLWTMFHGLAMLWSQGAIQGVAPDASLDQLHHTMKELISSDQHGGNE